AITHPFFELKGKARITVTNWASTDDVSWDQVVLASTAPETLTKATQKAFDNCLALKDLDIPQCGFSPIVMPGGAMPDPATIQRVVTTGDWKDLQWLQPYGKPLEVQAESYLRIQTTIKDRAGKSHEFDDTIYGVSIDLTDPANIVITFGDLY
ncbi:MAG: hypothetical protein LBE83_05810, partial [Propionibacteriaceae bacterium]|nr:hypothetical protein [Propionibacteriaceae bacterium]